MQGKAKGIELLKTLSALYQQRVISRETKDKLASEIYVSMKSGNYSKFGNLNIEHSDDGSALLDEFIKEAIS